MAPPVLDPAPRRRRKRRRPEPAQFARTSEGRVRVWEWSACGEPLPWPEYVGNEQPPCQGAEPEADDESRPYYPAEV